MLKEKDYVYIQSYKHDGSLHRTWIKGFVIEVNEKRTVVVTDRACVVESDGRRWITREPAICFFYPDKWFNVISMIRKTGIHYYCNLASPSIYDGEAIKNIDYDLDIKVMPDGSYRILDEDEYEKHGELMGYDEQLDQVIHKEMNDLIELIEQRMSPFDEEEIKRLYHKYQKLLKE